MLNRLTSATSPQSSATYTYHPLSRRSGKTVTGDHAEDLRFLYDGAEVIADTDPSATIVRRYVYGPGIDEPVAMYIGATTATRRFYLTDPQGSVIGLTWTAGVIQDSYQYSAYGIP